MNESYVFNLIGAILVIAGWLFVKWKDKKNEEFKTRLARREVLVSCFLRVNKMIQMSQGGVDKYGENFTSEWLDLANLMKLYGTEKEYAALLNFSNAFLGAAKNVEDANKKFNELGQAMISSIRKELGIVD